MGKATAAYRVSGSLQPFAHGFVLWLIELGYEWTAQRARLRLMAELSSWMAARGVEPAGLTLALVEEFLVAARAREAGMPWCSQTSERQLLVYLRGLGLVQEPEALVVSDPLDRLVADFVEYLVRERGLAVGSHSVHEYERTARLFLSGRIDPDGGGLERLTAGDVTRFVLAQCRQRSGRMSWALVSSLRGLLRFLFVEGLTPHDLTGAVLGVAKWRGGSLPKALPVDHVARLLASCDQTSAVGRRDFAVLTVLSRLGLRACEVARLELGDVDWRAGEIIVRGKQGPAPVPDGARTVRAADRGCRRDRNARPLRI